MNHFPPSRALPLLLPLTLGTAEVFAQAPDAPVFKPAHESVKGWYHRHEIDSWVAAGAERNVIDDVLKRVGESRGERRDSNLVDTQIADGPGNWAYEWAQAGDASMAAARKQATAGHREKAKVLYRSALVYFTTASWPHLGRPDDRAALAKAREAYLALGKLLPNPIEHREFAVGGATSKGFLHLPKGAGPFPVVIYTSGTDVSKEHNLDFFLRELSPRGIAMFSVDMPGLGDSADLNLLNGSDAVITAAATYLRRIPAIDETKVYLVGSSVGGNAAVRAFLTQEFAGVVSMCAPLHRPFMAPAQSLDALPTLTTDGLKARVGLLGSSNDELAKVLPRLSIQAQGLYRREAPVKTPLLIVTTNADPVAPVQDLKPLQDAASNSETLVFNAPGHCPPRSAGQAVTGRWIADQLAR
ncbi:MAG: hypothetical protein RLZZ200_2688 [Pseudomonadota bacterium]